MSDQPTQNRDLLERDADGRPTGRIRDLEGNREARESRLEPDVEPTAFDEAKAAVIRDLEDTAARTANLEMADEIAAVPRVPDPRRMLEIYVGTLDGDSLGRALVEVLEPVDLAAVAANMAQRIYAALGELVQVEREVRTNYADERKRLRAELESVDRVLRSIRELEATQ